MPEQLIKEIPMKGSPNWYNWDQRWSQHAAYKPKDSVAGNSAVLLTDNPLLKEGIKIRTDGIVYDSKALKLYSVKPQVLDMLKYCDGKCTRNEVIEKFGKETLEAAIKFGLLI